jgi:hypothetical protein
MLVYVMRFAAVAKICLVRLDKAYRPNESFHRIDEGGRSPPGELLQTEFGRL